MSYIYKYIKFLFKAPMTGAGTGAEMQRRYFGLGSVEGWHVIGSDGLLGLTSTYAKPAVHDVGNLVVGIVVGFGVL
jgi:hypothetical protein